MELRLSGLAPLPYESYQQPHTHLSSKTAHGKMEAFSAVLPAQGSLAFPCLPVGTAESTSEASVPLQLAGLRKGEMPDRKH